jgi:NADH-quinone oxidoreductase subunit C
MDAQAIIDSLSPLVPGASFEAVPSVDFVTIYAPVEHIVATCQALRDSLKYEVLVEVTCADYLPRVPRYEVVYHFLSVSKKLRLRVKVRVTADGTVSTVQGVYPGAGWLEREVWDMFGIVFDGHNDLRRLLMPEDWEGHPQRKDYPVQIQKAAQTYAPLEVSEEQFRASLERDRVNRPH